MEKDKKCMTIGEYFYEKNPQYCIETFKTIVRKLKTPHELNSWPYRYKKEDLDKAFDYMVAHSRPFVY